MSRTPSDDDPLTTPAGEREDIAGEAVTPPDADNSAALLAELDVLLERMMALPVNELDEEKPAPRSPAPPQDTEIDEVGGRRMPPEDTEIVTVAEAMPEPPLSSPALSPDDLYVQAILQRAREERPATPLPEPAAVYHPPEPEQPVLRSEPPPPAYTPPPMPPLAPPAPEQPPEVESEVSPWGAPIRLCNAGYDRLMGLLGTPGRWLQGKHGRTLVGIAGILMLLAAAGLAVRDCLEWTR
jgi:hypothetical protein